MYIKDNITGTVRLYGSDHHDSLKISDDGKYLTYYNLQCGEGSRFGSYSFVTDEKGKIPQEDEVLIKCGADAYFNIGGFDDTELVLKQLKEEIRLLFEPIDKADVFEVIDKSLQATTAE